MTQISQVFPNVVPSISLYPTNHESFEMVIPRNVENKIRHLCNNIHDVEWSGVLYYDYEGSWKDNNLKIICKDIYLMDIGSHTYTEFEINPDVLTYAIDNDLLDCQRALIHSHCTFSAFFSGTDVATLTEEGSKMNHFVSLIVNNAGQYVARITRKVNKEKRIIEEVSYNTFDDVKIEGEKTPKTETETCIEYANLNITVEGDSFVALDTRIKEIKNSKTIKKPVEKVETDLDFNPKFLPKVPDYRQYNSPSLFNYYKNDEEGEEFINTQDIVIPDEEVDKIVLQLISGSILCKDTSKIKKMAASMEKLLDNRFKDIEIYENFIFNFVSDLLEEASFDKDKYYTEALAERVTDALNQLPENKYINIIIIVLESWMS